ncbi:MAG: polyprenyl synthetase family protein [Chlamydiae bacterium]|nr:polyprenyl synthetase family protein [Chlamydiota bacterium]MBI3278173.1 polyprenyl synthetase family protein [Chlamydiota bacterium]
MTTLLEIKKLIEPLVEPLSEVEQLILREVSSSKFDFINEAAQHITLDQGKRLRPILILASAKAFGTLSHDHILLAVIVELLHTATLLHDDVLDEADTRRHRKSVNAQWGNTTSVLLGDYLFARAFMLLSSLKSNILFELISETTKDICEGELLQIRSAGNPLFQEEEYFEMIRKKTAVLFTSCCQGSAIISGAKPIWIEGMRRYGDFLGQAFQIGDDIMDLTGSSLKEGKTLGTDLKKGKLTLPLIHLLARLGFQERQQLENLIMQKKSDLSFIQIQGLLSRGQGFPETLKVISGLCQSAIDEVDRFPSDYELTLFRAIPHYILSEAKGRLVQIEAEPIVKSA